MVAIFRLIDQFLDKRGCRYLEVLVCVRGRVRLKYRVHRVCVRRIFDTVLYIIQNFRMYITATSLKAHDDNYDNSGEQRANF